MLSSSLNRQTTPIWNIDRSLSSRLCAWCHFSGHWAPRPRQLYIIVRSDEGGKGLKRVEQNTADASNKWSNKYFIKIDVIKHATRVDLSSRQAITCPDQLIESLEKNNLFIIYFRPFHKPPTHFQKRAWSRGHMI